MKNLQPPASSLQPCLLPFVFSLGIHLLLLCFFSSFVERPENGLAKGLSSLEVHLSTAPQKNDTLAFSEIKKTTLDKKIPSEKIPEEKNLNEKQDVSQKEKTFAQHASQKTNIMASGVAHDAENFSSAASGAVTATPHYLHNPQPLYPEQERRSGHEGTVLLRVTINEHGGITRLAIEHSSGYPALDEQAATTVEKKWSFRPAQQNHQPIASTVLIPIRFSIEE